MSEQLLTEMSLQLQSDYVFNSNASFCFHTCIYKSLMLLLMIQDSFFHLSPYVATNVTKGCIRIK